jgi:lipopolysaccharide/colanic/teichoic acid biosynthesis glycosyltransferase
LDFLNELSREMRRAERSGAPLSVVLFEHEPSAARTRQASDALLDVLSEAKRDSDTLGLLAGSTIALLCPDTDAPGVAALLRRLRSLGAAVPAVTVSATYPDSLFESLAQRASNAGTNCASGPVGSLLNSISCSSADCTVSSIEHAGNPHAHYYGKRALDLAGALLALLLLAPIMALVALAVALSSPGPIIFRQTRLGRAGRPFTFYKFRSMASGADVSLHRDFVTELIRNGDSAATAPGELEAGYKIASDPRVTPLGRFMRRTSLDELPQLFNVLRGDMSLVGPRPAIPYEVASYQPWHLRRVLSVRPGITGLWQVQGRSRVCFNEMVRMDLRYIRQCSLGLDLRILLRTLAVVLRCDGAV